ncbi:MAG: NADH-quinone oxidoreductase subunit N [Pirellulales bacterium]|nr:NADH-quinone oxidoreductase subunit N [Pirellulales bacterium]
MNFPELIQSVFDDTLGPGQSLSLFRPELTLCATMIAILLARMILPRWKTSGFYLVLLGLTLALAFVFPWRWFAEGALPGQEIFTGLLAADRFSVALRGLLLLFTLLFVTFTQIAGRWAPEDGAEFFVLLLGAVLGMCLMVSANHVIVVLLGMEMASLPCYVLAGWQRDRRVSSEAALKYAVFGAAAAGILLFGMSLLAGALGSVHLPTMGRRLAELLQAGVDPAQLTALILGGLMVTVGVAFKLAAFPFHFWIPDVFEGATAEVAAFISVASKAAALGLLVRLAGAFVGVPDARQFLVVLVSLLAAVTCTFGNLAAYGQNNLKRLLAYSTIAHAGYMMMPVAAMIALAGGQGSPDAPLSEAQKAVAALLVYLGIYLFMNLAAFAGVAFMRNVAHSEDLRDYAGLVHSSPGFTVCMAIVMFSLLGIPPLSGFTAKWTIFLALVSAKLWTLLAIGVLNTVLSLFYYLRVVKVMTLDAPPADRAAPRIPLTSAAGAYFAMLTVPVVALFFLWGGLSRWADAAAQALFFTTFGP